MRSYKYGDPRTPECQYWCGAHSVDTVTMTSVDLAIQEIMDLKEVDPNTDLIVYGYRVYSRQNEDEDYEDVYEHCRVECPSIKEWMALDEG